MIDDMLSTEKKVSSSAVLRNRERSTFFMER